MARERVLILEVDILVRILRVRNITSQRVRRALREVRVAHSLLVDEDRVRQGRSLRLVDRMVAATIVRLQLAQDVSRDPLVGAAYAFHLLTALVLVGQAHAAAEHLLVFATVI